MPPLSRFLKRKMNATKTTPFDHTEIRTRDLPSRGTRLSHTDTKLTSQGDELAGERTVIDLPIFPASISARYIP